MWRERSNTCVHDLRTRRVLRDHKRSRPCTFEVERPPAHQAASDIGEFVHVVLRLQCVRDEPWLITARRKILVLLVGTLRAKNNPAMPDDITTRPMLEALLEGQRQLGSQMAEIRAAL